MARELTALEREFVAYRRVLQELLQGAASASISGGSGSKSYTNHDIEKVRQIVNEYAARVEAERAAASSSFGRRVRPDFGRSW